ncbi:unnamed protein product [Rhizophagus irregularis]|nr:unnamed protein product [Rhizophagus irregularis]
MTNPSREIGDYWTEKPPKRHIHAIVSPPETTTTSSREEELLSQVASLKALLNKSIHEFDVVLHPKRKPNKWTASIEQVTLEGLKDYIRKEYGPPSLEKDGAVLKFTSEDKERYSPWNDQDLREMLQLFVAKNSFKFTVIIETPSKGFAEWSFPKVCQLYGLAESDDPSLSVFPPFTCECKDLEDDSSREILRNLITELKACLKSIPISGNEASKSQYVCSYLVAGYCSECCTTLSNRKRKASEMEEDVFTGKTFGIITDAKEWYFMECSYNEGKPSFKLSEPVTVVYKDEDMQAKVERVLGHIAWLLEEAQKPDSDFRSEERVIKKHRSSSNLTGKSDK